MHFRLTTIGRYKNRKSRVTLLTIASRQRALCPFFRDINRDPAEAQSVDMKSAYLSSRRSVPNLFQSTSVYVG